MFRGISLANKCLLLFGGAVVLIVVAALALPALRMWRLIDEAEIQRSRDLVDIWVHLDDKERRERPDATGQPLFPALQVPAFSDEGHAGINAERIPFEQAKRQRASDAFLDAALDALEADTRVSEHHAQRWQGITRLYDYARVERSSPSRISAVVVLRRQSIETFRLLWVGGVFFAAAAAAVLSLAVLVFYLITHRIILQPVRALKDTAERVREGNVAVRSDISTGDEFEELARTFNMMLTDLQTNQDRLRALNQAMDVKLHEMAESNTLLHESARLKGEFLANVSHELRTPLNSIIGFAELLLEQARAESGHAESSPALQRRVRYLSNIDTAGRNLLAHINSLLEMARIEAGRIDIQPERVVLRDACEGLLGLIHPLAARRGIETRLEVQDDVPAVVTDIKKFQQVIFNFLSNAVKFSLPQEKSGRVPEVVLRVDKLPPARPEEDMKVRVSVIDNGPGIPEEEQQRIFDKFYQVDAGHTRESTGTGLGLAICRELAHVLNCEIQLVSGVNRGSMFSLIMPLTLVPAHAAEAALEARLRGTLSGGRSWSGDRE